MDLAADLHDCVFGASNCCGLRRPEGEADRETLTALASVGRSADRDRRRVALGARRGSVPRLSVVNSFGRLGRAPRDWWFRDSRKACVHGRRFCRRQPASFVRSGEGPIGLLLLGALWDIMTGQFSGGVILLLEITASLFVQAIVFVTPPVYLGRLIRRRYRSARPGLRPDVGAPQGSSGTCASQP